MLPLYEAGSSWQDGGCATHNPHPARGLRPLDSRNARRFASRIPKAASMKDKNTEDGGRSAARQWVTIRVTEREKTRLTEQAEIAGLSLSEYMRRRFFGGRPLVAHTDLSAVAELRRIGGLLKHNFETLRQAKAHPDILERQEDALRKLVWAIQKISLRCHHDRQENQEYEN